MSLAERPWLSKYLEEFDYKIEDMVSSVCYQVFRFGGIEKKHESRLSIELSLMVTSTKGKEDVLAYMYVIEVNVTFLTVMKTLEHWGSILNTRRNVLETKIKGTQKD